MIGVVNTLVDLGVFLVAYNVFAAALGAGQRAGLAGRRLRLLRDEFLHHLRAESGRQLRLRDYGALRRLRHRRGRHQHHRAGDRRLLDAGAGGEAAGDRWRASWSISRCRISWCSAPATAAWRRLRNDARRASSPRARRCVVRRQPDRRAADLRHPSGMLGDRRALSGRRAAQPLARRQAAAGALRPRRRAQGAEQGGAGAAAARPLALSRAPAGAPHARHRQPRRGGDAARRHAQAFRRARRRRDPDQGRGPAADRLVQGARPGHGGVDGEGARRHPHGDADQRQCRRRARRLCQPLRHPHDHLLSRGHAGGERQRDRAAGRRASTASTA